MPKQKPEPKIFLVVQQGGSSGEMFLHTMDTKRTANAYRKSAAKASYNTSEPIEIPVSMEKYLGSVQNIVDAVTAML